MDIFNTNAYEWQLDKMFNIEQSHTGNDQMG